MENDMLNRIDTGFKGFWGLHVRAFFVATEAFLDPILKLLIDLLLKLFVWNPEPSSVLGFVDYAKLLWAFPKVRVSYTLPKIR